MVSNNTKFIWAIKIYNSPHTTDIFSWNFGNKEIIGKPASKKDFERLVGCGENNREFSLFFKELIEYGALTYKGEFKKENNKKIKFKGYICTRKIYNYLKENKDTKEIFNNSKLLIDRERII